MDDIQQIFYAASCREEEGRFQEALNLYQTGLESLMEKLKQPGTAEMKESYKHLMNKYLCKAENLKNRKQENAAPFVKEFRISNDETGWSYRRIICKPMDDKPTHVRIQDPYLQSRHQISNLVALCEVLASCKSVFHIRVITKFASEGQQRTNQASWLSDLGASLESRNITFITNYSETLHDREIRFKNEDGVVWTVILGRGLDMFKKLPNWNCLGTFDMSFRKCHECTITVTKGG